MHSDPPSRAPVADHVYVIHLRAPGAASLQGWMEHVASGRRHDFDSGQGLLDCLWQEEAQVARECPRACGR